MVEKIIVNPNEIRGYGNIMLTHSSTDYDLSDCTIESGTDTVDGATKNIMILTPDYGPTPPAPTYLFQDDCSSSSGLSNYGSSECVRGSTASITMEYDSNENAYKVYGSGNYHAYKPITALANEDEYTISMECKGKAIRYNMVGFFLDNSADTTSYGLCFGLDIGKADNNSNQSLYSRLYRPNSDGNGYITYLNSNVLTANTWYKLTFTVDGDTLTGALYDGNTKLAEKTVTYTINNKTMGIFLMCETGTTNSVCYIRNIKAESLSPSPTPTPTDYSLAFSQSTYTTSMFDGATVDCTLTNGGTPVTGETVTFTWDDPLGPQSTTATTNSSGVATHYFDYWDIGSYPVTITATYDTVSATCTIVE